MIGAWLLIGAGVVALAWHISSQLLRERPEGSVTSRGRVHPAGADLTPETLQRIREAGGA